MNRRHDIDALRALAFALLILYHLAMVYIRDWGFHVKSSYTTQAIELPMLFVNRWRMDLIFLISGIATAFMLRGARMREFLPRRAWRLLLPLVFGMAVVVPIQPYAQGVMNGLVEPGFLQFLGRYYTGYPWPAKAFDGSDYGFTWNHLWYLAYLLFYTVVLALLAPVLGSRAGNRVKGAFLGLRGWRLLVYPAAPLLFYTLALQPRFGETHDLIHDWYLHAMYFTMFLWGVWLGADEAIWKELARLRKATLALALGVFTAYIVMAFNAGERPSFPYLLVARALRNAYIWLALCTLLGWGHALLDRPFRWVPFANEAVYPWYVLHQSVIVLLAYWLIPLRVGPVLEPALLVAGTVLACWALQVHVIARIAWLRPCFGMRTRPPLAQHFPGEVSKTGPAARQSA